jgi:hypothetical protein
MLMVSNAAVITESMSCEMKHSSSAEYDMSGNSIASMISGHRKTINILPGYSVLTRMNKKQSKHMM